MVKFIWRVASAHTTAYFIAGLFAMSFLKYDQLFSVGKLSFMRSTDTAWVAAGPGLQLFKGIILGSILYPFRSIFLETKNGWIKFWGLIFGLSYILTLSAAVGSYEGIIYTNIPLKIHFLGLPEILLYTTLFSTILWGWHKKPIKAFNIAAIILTSIIILLSTMGVLSSIGLIQVD